MSDSRMRQEVIDLYDEYTHRPLPRRAFMERLVAMVGSVAAANAALALLEPNAAKAQTVAPDDPRITVTENHSLAEGVVGLLALPRDNSGKVSCSWSTRTAASTPISRMWRGAWRPPASLLRAGLPPCHGRTPADPDQAREMFPKLAPADVLSLSRKAVLGGGGSSGGSGKAGMVGFCWGGGVVNRSITGIPELAAGVAYYGVAPDLAQVPGMKGALMVHLAGQDERVNSTYPPYEAALKAAGKSFVIHRYEGVQHAFNNDTSAERYDDRAAADLAWSRTLDFFRKELAGAAKAG